MSMKKMSIDGHDIIFFNETWETYRAWGHKTTFYLDNIELNSAKCRYYNRTWECYQYQSIMKSCVYAYMEKIENMFLQDYKNSNGIKRFSKKSKEDAIAEMRKNTRYELLEKIYNAL